ncbi:hypothetical protein TSMG0123 [Halocynthia phage JM-2012]|uniref:hypothetical protein n=1 Tax=Halocynthia phage JM-2012 TaxID=1173297 RepID=UPI00025C6957|nr:hypothetical protein TSMG0123 [Halocynthia phage JM-2012]AFI55406.1 hypothetical protein TSMG0123 [Halocynthia phage JM-2012]
MDDRRKYSEYILGNARCIESITKEELYSVPKRAGDVLYIWRKCFIKTLIIHKMQVDDFKVAYNEFKLGNKTRILELRILPPPLLLCKRLALLYMQGLFYTAFKRDIEEELKQQKRFLTTIE